MPGRSWCTPASVSADQKADLDRQFARVTSWATGQHVAVAGVVTEVGCALHGHRKKFLAVLRDPAVSTIVVEHRDRFAASVPSTSRQRGISRRHLSFVELVKSKPSPSLLMEIARHLDVPLRERIDWLLAAGYAPRYPETPLSSPALARVRRSLQALLDAHDPFPGAAIDRQWNVQLTNPAARRLVFDIPAEVRGIPTNIFRTALHPAGLAARTRNFSHWSAYVLRQLDRAVIRTQDPALAALADEVATWPSIPDRDAWTASHRTREAILSNHGCWRSVASSYPCSAR